MFALQPPSLLPRSVASKGIFTCKICGTAHVSWDEFSRHFLLAHGSVPRILLKYKCVPCNVSFAFREKSFESRAVTSASHSPANFLPTNLSFRGLGREERERESK